MSDSEEDSDSEDDPDFVAWKIIQMVAGDWFLLSLLVFIFHVSLSETISGRKEITIIMGEKIKRTK